MPSVAACAVGVSAVVVPLRVSEIVTRLPASAVPLIVGVVALVRSSDVVPAVDAPALSEAVVRSRVGVAVEISIVMTSDADAPLVLPAASVDFAVRVCDPSESEDEVIDHVPVVCATPLTAVPEVVAVPSTVVPSVS